MHMQSLHFENETRYNNYLPKLHIEQRMARHTSTDASNKAVSRVLRHIGK